MARNHLIQDWQISYIESNHQEKTLQQLSDGCGVSVSFVYCLCIKRGWKFKRLKPAKGSVAKAVPKELPKAFINGERAYIPDKPKQIKRFPAVYDNTPSPYGIASQLHGN